MTAFPDVAGGLNRYLADLHDALAADGTGQLPRSLVLGPCSAPQPGVIAVSDYRRPLPLRWFHLTQAAFRLAKDVDLLDAHFALYALPLVFGPARRLPLVVHFQGSWADENCAVGSTRAAIARRWVERRVYHRATVLVTLSAAFKGVLVESYGVAPWRIEVVPPPVNLERFTPGDKRVARDRLGIPNDSVVVTTVRRLVPRMGISTLLRAWHEASALLPDPAILIIGGAGSEEETLRQLADELGIASTVRFAGRLSEEDLVELYQASDIFVVPSIALEGFGLVLLEALACGTPVIASDVGGLPEAVAGMNANVVVPAGDVSSLAARLVSAFSGDAPLPSAAACRQHAERFSPGEVASRHRKIYEQAVRPAAPRLRVVYLDHCARESGGELALLRLLTAFGAVDAHVILGEDGPLVELLRAAGISVEVLPMRSSVRNLRKDTITSRAFPLVPAILAAAYSLKIAWRLRQLKPDLVHTNTLKAAVYGGLAARLARIPVVWHLRDRIERDYLPAAAVHIVRGLARVVPNGLIANSNSTLATLPGREGPRTIIPSPVIYDTVAVPRQEVPNPRAHARIAMVGRVAPWKGQHLFIEAFAQAFPDPGPTATIIGGPLFGEDEYEDQLRQLIENLGLKGRVVLTGHVHDVAEMLRTCDIAVNASISPEPFGLVVVEAMAAGLAVIAANAGGPAEVITHDRDGLLFVPGSSAALATALRRLGADPALRHRLGDAARTRAAEFSPDKIAKQTLDLYRAVLPNLPSTRSVH